ANSFWQPLLCNKIAKIGTFLVIHIQAQLLYKLIHRNKPSTALQQPHAMTHGLLNTPDEQ
ncbi:hypothetical protein, partial [Aeromonas caviae]|uniref:hypothetical protein n=1 Tax=Aeromonas caviae TaxID=648 RepID=UPI002B4A6D2B